jgi:hypothetical protein
MFGKLSRAFRLRLTVGLLACMVGSLFAPAVLARPQGVQVAAHQDDDGDWDDDDDDGYYDEGGTRHRRPDDRDRDRDQDRRRSEDDDEDGESKGKAVATAGAAALGVALSGVALSYILPMVVGPVSFLPTALLWGSAAVAAPLFVYLYNKFMDKDMNDNTGVGLLSVGGLGLLGSVAAATLFPAAGIVAGVIGATAGAAVGMPLFDAWAVDGDGKGSDDDDDDGHPSDDGDEDTDELWDRYDDLTELHDRVREAYEKFLDASRDGSERLADKWLDRYRRLEAKYRELKRDYDEDRVDAQE